MDRENRVREIAYFLWEEEGRPDREAERHWLAAELICDSDDAERKDVEGEPPGERAEAPDAATAKPSGESRQKGESKQKSAA